MNEDISKETRKKYYTANKAHIRERQKLYYAANKARLLADKKTYYVANRSAALKYYAVNRDARLEYRRKYYLANKAAILKRHEAYRAANKARIKERRVAHRIANHSAILERERARAFANSDKSKAYRSKWDKAHPDQLIQKSAIRRGRKAGAKGHHTLADLEIIWKRQRGICPDCKTKLHKERGLPNSRTLDHIIPLANGGSNWPDNIRWTCHSCNRKKGAKGQRMLPL